MNSCVDLLSPPAWWCGLKFNTDWGKGIQNKVTTCVVVWIEIAVPGCCCSAVPVTTCVVVWIEILVFFKPSMLLPGHHLRGGVD